MQLSVNPRPANPFEIFSASTIYGPVLISALAISYNLADKLR
jgi:hypothetical protein